MKKIRPVIERDSAAEPVDDDDDFVMVEDPRTADDGE